MKICQTVLAIRNEIAAWRESKQRIGLVATMGNLHAGHLSLITRAKQHATKVVTSLFVNPLQFGPLEDFAHYPRTVESDLEKLTELNVDAVFLPQRETLYPRSEEEFVHMDLPMLSHQLCGITRPQFFPGILVIVAKLFNIIQPDVAVFGEKDYQQLTLVKQMVEDLNFPLTILSGSTVREADGLAMSSRNSYLTDAERKQAPLLYQTLCSMKEQLIVGKNDFEQLEKVAREQLDRHGFHTDYIAIRNQADLSKPSLVQKQLIILVAAYLGKTRLIDNIFCDVIDEDD